MNTEIIVEERSQVAQARRETVALANRMAFDASVTDTLGLAVTEIATNLVKHGGGGTVLMAPLIAASVGGIEIIAIDRGPGIANVAQSMRDGHSTAGSPGLGLGSLSRLATNLDIYSKKGPRHRIALRTMERGEAAANQARHGRWRVHRETRRSDVWRRVDDAGWAGNPANARRGRAWPRRGRRRCRSIGRPCLRAGSGCSARGAA